MSDQELPTIPGLAHVAVIGGGRWARVLTDALMSLLPLETRISVHSPHNAAAMTTYARSVASVRELDVSSSLPEFADSKRSAAIVVNAARDHDRAIEWLLDAGVAALVEKPMASGEERLNDFVGIARKRAVKLAPAHVFLFASYLARFAACVAASGPVSAARLWWTDPRIETRHGEPKRYDPSLPIFADWIPHVVSVLLAVLGDLPDRVEELGVGRGGARVDVVLRLPNMSCDVHLERNSDRRRRIFEVSVPGGPLRLDFSQEPGTITQAGSSISAGPLQPDQCRPSARMLGAFLTWASGPADARADPGLDIEVALRGCRLSDSIKPGYRKRQQVWLAATLASGAPVDADLRYALCELLQCEGGLPSPLFEQQIQRLRDAFAGAAGASHVSALMATDDPHRILSTIIS